MPYEPGPLPEWDPNDPRVPYQRVVDDILTKIERGELYANAPLPSARKMADIYGVGVMTIQRALRELQQERITYSIAGKGTFIHPDIVDLREDAHMRKAMADPDRVRRVATYLAEQAQLLHRYDTAESAKDKNAAMRDLLSHTQAHRDLLEQVAAAVAGPNVGTPYYYRQSP